MDFKKIVNKFNASEIKTQHMEEAKAYRILKEFMRVHGKEDIEKFYYSSTLIDLIYKLYFELKGTEKGEFLEKLLMKKGSDFSASVHNSIYHLLGNEIDYAGVRKDSTKFFGIDSIKSNGVQHVLQTSVGRIEVYNATQIFRNDKAREIFKLQLPHMCYARTYDFVKMYPDSYKAVIMKMPNLLYGGHYHAYIEGEDDVIDIAANAYYDSKEDASKTLCGEVIGKYTYDEIERFCEPYGNDSFEDRTKIYIMTAHKALGKNR